MASSKPSEHRFSGGPYAGQSIKELAQDSKPTLDFYLSNPYTKTEDLAAIVGYYKENGLTVDQSSFSSGLTDGGTKQYENAMRNFIKFGQYPSQKPFADFFTLGRGLHEALEQQGVPHEFKEFNDEYIVGSKITINFSGRELTIYDTNFGDVADLDTINRINPNLIEPSLVDEAKQMRQKAINNIVNGCLENSAYITEPTSGNKQSNQIIINDEEFSELTADLEKAAQDRTEKTIIDLDDNFSDNSEPSTDEHSIPSAEYVSL